MKGLQFVYIFVGALIGFLFVDPIGDLAADAANNSSGIAATIYGYMDEFYALLLLGLMVGSLVLFFKGRR